ncbi:hypothetical protein ACTPEF_24290, partial [Clostridioides difficile]
TCVGEVNLHLPLFFSIVSHCAYTSRDNDLAIPLHLDNFSLLAREGDLVKISIDEKYYLKYPKVKGA